MRWLLFDLVAPLASFGGPAPGSIRDSQRLPSRGALLGLLGAALGIQRDDAPAQAELSEALRFASRVRGAGHSRVLRDYHTAQAPKAAAMKGRPHRTRSDELAVPKSDLSTVLSDRYYYTDFSATIGAVTSDTGIALERLAEALQKPRYTLYLGRKSCPPQWPLRPHIVEADDWLSALREHDRTRQESQQLFERSLDRPKQRGDGIRFLPSAPSDQAMLLLSGDQGDEHTDPLPLGAELPHMRIVHRRDQPLDRSRWLFAERREWQVETDGGAS